MGICPNCGSWVDEGDICMTCGGSGSYTPDRDDPEEDTFINPIYQKRDEYSKKAWDHYMEFDEEIALNYINRALEIDKRHSGNWNKKAIILEALKRYRQSEECYDESLRLNPKKLVFENKARMLYRWATDLREDSKKLSDGFKMLYDAKQICLRAIDTIPDNSEEDIEKYLKLKESIDYYIGYEMKFRENLRKLKSYSKNRLFTITGRTFYKNRVVLTPGMDLRLVKEPDNEFDSKAIAVYADDEKIGYVANKDYTKYELTSSASEIYDKFADSCDAKYLVYLDRYAEIQFSIGRILI